MKQEVKYFKRVNKNLGPIVEDLSMRQQGLASESSNLMTEVEKQEKKKQDFHQDVFEAMQHIPEYKKLKKKIIELYKVYVLSEKVHDDSNNDKKSTSQKRNYRESMVQYSRTQVITNQAEHKQQNAKYMKENVSLLQEINDLKKAVHAIEINNRLLIKESMPNPQDEFLDAPPS